MKLIIKSAILFICSVSLAQTNLIDTSSWFEGTGSVSGFNQSGGTAENIREMGIGPHGTSVLLWKTIPEATGNSGAGGWTTDFIDIDHTKTYRLTVWVKKINSFDGITYFRAQTRDSSGLDTSSLNNLNDTYNSNPFFGGDNPPTLNTWYLYVAYVHNSSYENTVSIGGIYSAATGVKMLAFNDFKFQSDAIKMNHNIWLANDINVSDSQYYYGPTIYEVNGLEPSIQDIINAQPDSQKPSKPILSSASKTDTTVDLSWIAATDNIGVIGYHVYKGGVLEATLGNVLNYQVTGLTASTPYSFTVTALDVAGNESINSNALNITTNTMPVPATNLLDTSTWTEGTGSVVGFTIVGTNAETSRILGTDPHGLQNVLWKAQPVDNTTGKRGWYTDYINIDHTKTYRFTCWFKKTNSNDGAIYLTLRCRDDLDNDAGLDLLNSSVVNAQLIAFGSNLPHLDEWYLLVGYMHESGYNSTTSIGGVYNTNGVKQTNMKDDFKFSNTSTRLKMSNYLEFSTNTNDELFSFGPTIYEVNGQEPTIPELISAQLANNPTYPSGNSGYWSLNNQDVYYTDGNVGIGTSIPDSKLTVKGNIHSEEVKVDLSVPAPDYVFNTDYELTPLETLQQYIKENNHLPNISTAKDLEANGIELGTMNMKLLEKIEELTLYILKQEKRIEKLEDLLIESN